VTSVCRPAMRRACRGGTRPFAWRFLIGTLSGRLFCLAGGRRMHGSGQKNARDIKPLAKHPLPNRDASDSACLQPYGNPIMHRAGSTFFREDKPPRECLLVVALDRPCAVSFPKPIHRALPKASLNVHA
jgi:hypothetical protein